MKISITHLRKKISKLILESSGLHRCLNGQLVPEDSEECYGDLCDRIEDMTYNRDTMHGGTATRAFYNGVLADLRKKKRRLAKLYQEI